MRWQLGWPGLARESWIQRAQEAERSEDGFAFFFLLVVATDSPFFVVVDVLTWLTTTGQPFESSNRWVKTL